MAFHGSIDGRQVFLKRFDVGDVGLRNELQSRARLPPHPAILQPTGYLPESQDGTESVRVAGDIEMQRGASDVRDDHERVAHIDHVRRRIFDTSSFRSARTATSKSTCVR